jgi:hypothetical protein
MDGLVQIRFDISINEPAVSNTSVSQLVNNQTLIMIWGTIHKHCSKTNVR